MAVRKPLVAASGQLAELPAGDHLASTVLAIQVGDTTPDPGAVPAYAWSSVLEVEMVWRGTSWQQRVLTPGQSLALARGLAMP